MGEAHRWGRIAALLALEARVQWRYGIVGMAAALTAAWTGLLVALPDPAAHAVAPLLLMLETAVLGSTLAGALVLLERSHGMRAALAVSPARIGEYLTAKLGFLTALVLASAVPVALAGRPATLAPVLLGVGLTAVLTMLIAVAVAASRQSVISFMIALPLVLLPLLAPAVARGAGLRHPLLYASPVTGAMDLVKSGYGQSAGTALGWPVAFLLLAILVARRPYNSHQRPRSRVSLLPLIGASPVLLGLAARFGYPPLHDWLLRAYGFDLDPYRPLLLAVAVILHVPMTFGMIGALLVLDDVDDRALVALRVSPLTLPRYLARRAGLVTAATLAGLLVAVPLSGLVPLAPRLVPAGLLAALLAPLIMLATLAVATNKVEGLAVLKLLGLPLYAPLATWWLTGPAGWPFAALPSWWVLRSLWAGWPDRAAGEALGFAAGGLVVTAAALVLLTRRALTTLRR